MKKQSKTAAIRALLEQGKTVAEIAKKLKVKAAAVYQVRYQMRRHFDIGAKAFDARHQGAEQQEVKAKEEQEAREIDPVNTPLAYSAGMRDKYAHLYGQLHVLPEPVQEAVQVFPDDPVNHPSHYMVGGIEVIDFIRAKNFSYLLGNVIKYVSRSQHKGNYLEDLKKAQWYLTRAIEEAQQ